ncbi:MAG TPA: NAD(P)H-quinone oxidoreductase [Alphaproteobacteria bacterium]|nr:NAD(P)H-quinone oxidoreductase [Alphaproteobacteria bacterium]
MHAIYIKSPEELVYAETPMPSPKDGEVLIRVAAAGINRADILQRQSKYPPPPGASNVMGMEVSGEIAAVGQGVKRWKAGDKVCALIEGGGYAEYAVAREGQCFPVPKNISMIEAAALPEALVTVYANLFDGTVKAGETILVHGGSSGIGTTAIQMAKLFGVKIFVTAGSDEKCEACRKLGADLAINYKTEDFVAAVEKATGGQGVNAVLDMVGGDYVNRNLATLASFGRHISIATQQGKNATVDFRLIMQKRAVVTGSTLRGRSPEEKARLCREVEAKVWPWVEKGQLKPLIYKTFPIKNALDAHKMMESSAHIGKITLEVA